MHISTFQKRILIIKSTKSAVSKQKTSEFTSLLQQIGYNPKVLFVPSPLSFVLGETKSIKSSIKLIVQTLHEIIRSELVIIYQDNAFPYSLVAKILRKKIALYLGGSPYEMFKSSSDSKKNKFSTKLRQLLGLLTTIPTVKVSGTIIAISSTCLAGLPIRNKRIFTQVPGYSLSRKLEFFVKNNRFDERKNILLYVGRLEPEKGVMRIPEICKELDFLEFGIRVIVIGTGSLYEDVKKLSRECNNLELLGHIQNENLQQYYNDAKLTLIVSDTEGVPASLLESMLCGTPVLAVPVGGIPEVIEEGMNGYLIRNKDPKKIAKRISAVFQMLNEQVSENARASILKSNFLNAENLWREIIEREMK